MGKQGRGVGGCHFNREVARSEHLMQLVLEEAVVGNVRQATARAPASQTCRATLAGCLNIQNEKLVDVLQLDIVAQ